MSELFDKHLGKHEELSEAERLKKEAKEEKRRSTDRAFEAWTTAVAEGLYKRDENENVTEWMPFTEFPNSQGKPTVAEIRLASDFSSRPTEPRDLELQMRLKGEDATTLHHVASFVRYGESPGIYDGKVGSSGQLLEAGTDQFKEVNNMVVRLEEQLKPESQESAAA